MPEENEKKEELDKEEAYQPEPVREEEPSDWKKADYSDEADEYIATPWDHSYWLARPKLPKKLVDARQLLQKELSISRIDRTQAHFYSLFFSAAQDWVNLGLNGLAQDEIICLMGKLSLARSVGMAERLAQIPGLAPQLTVDMTDDQLEDVAHAPEEVPSGPKGPSVLDRFLGTTKKYTQRRSR